VATITPIVSVANPSTISPAPALGLSLCRLRTPTRGLKITASTAANVIGSTISLTAPRAANTMAVAATNPTKLQAPIPILGTQLSTGGRSLCRPRRSACRWP